MKGKTGGKIWKILKHFIKHNPLISEEVMCNLLFISGRNNFVKKYLLLYCFQNRFWKILHYFIIIFSFNPAAWMLLSFFLWAILNILQEVEEIFVVKFYLGWWWFLHLLLFLLLKSCNVPNFCCLSISAICKTIFDSFQEFPPYFEFSFWYSQQYLLVQLIERAIKIFSSDLWKTDLRVRWWHLGYCPSWIFFLKFQNWISNL